MNRFTTLPLTLFRIQARLPVSLRDQALQVARGRTSFDLVTHTAAALVRAMPVGDAFHTPNGMSLRPTGPNMAQILRQFQGDPRVYRMQAGTSLPPGTVVLHEHTEQLIAGMRHQGYTAEVGLMLMEIPNEKTGLWPQQPNGREYAERRAVLQGEPFAKGCVR